MADVETGFVSLLDLANTNTDEVAVVMSRLPAVGIYTVKGDTVAGSQSEPKDDKPPLIRFKFTYEILDVKPVDKSVDPQTLVGRKLSESYTLWPAEFEQHIGLLKGRYQKVGLSNKGNMGGVEGAAPGWLDSFVGHILQIRVYSFTSNGQEQRGYDWVGPAPTADETAT